MNTFRFGHTSLGLPIIAFRFGGNGKKVLILGGVHGDEVEGVIAAYALVDRFSEAFSLNLQLTIVPTFNLDGVLQKMRMNANGVDLNRNMPTNDWSSEIASPRYHPGASAGSEPETQALINYLDKSSPGLILSLHSWKPMLNINGNCRNEALAIQKFTDYQIEESIGYPTPGCLGTYTGLERDIPTLTYEIERGLPPEPILQLHVRAIVEALKITEQH